MVGGSQVSKEVSFVGMDNGFSLIKFTNEVVCNRVFEGQSGLLMDKFLVSRDGKRSLIRVQRKTLFCSSLGSAPSSPFGALERICSGKHSKPLGKIYKTDVNS